MSENWKRKIRNEVVEAAGIFVLVVLFFFMFATYRMMLLDAFSSKYFIYGTALVNAAVVSKVVAIGEAMRVGKCDQAQPLILTVLYKAFSFSLFAIAFELLEEALKNHLHGVPAFNQLRGVHTKEYVARTLIFFLAFIPFFAFRELAHVVGKNRTMDLFFRKGGVLRFDQDSTTGGRDHRPTQSTAA